MPNTDKVIIVGGKEYILKQEVEEALKDEHITLVRGNRKGKQHGPSYRYIKASDMPKYYRNQLRQEIRKRLEAKP